MNPFSKVIKNTFFQIIGRGAVILTTIITTAFLTRFLGTTGYGNYIFIISLILFFVTLADWGTGLVFVREAAKTESKQEKFFGNALFFRFALAFICLIILIIFTFIFVPLKSLSALILVASPLLLLISLKTSFHIVFQTKQRFEFTAIFDVFISLLFLVFILIGAYRFRDQLSLSLVLVFWVFSNLAGVGASVFQCLKMTRFDFCLDRQLLHKIFFEALPTGALLITFSIYNRIDIFILQILQGATSVGIYGLAYKIHDNLILGAAYLASSLFPLLSRLASEKGRDRQVLSRVYRKSFDLLFIGAFLVFGGVLLFAPQIIFLIGGNSFAESGVVLRVLVMATVFAYFNHLTGYTLIALGRQRVSLIIALVALFWNVGGNLILIPQFSYLGAAAVTVSTEGLVFVLTSLYLAKKFNLQPGLTFPQTLVEIIKSRGKIY